MTDYAKPLKDRSFGLLWYFYIYKGLVSFFFCFVCLFVLFFLFLFFFGGGMGAFFIKWGGGGQKNEYFGGKMSFVDSFLEGGHH